MKKIFTLLFMAMCFLLVNTKANAADATGYIPHKTIVKFQQDFSTKNPPKHFSVVMNNDCVVKNVRTVKQGTVLYLEVTKVSNEKIGKLNASVTARIVKAYIPHLDKTINVKKINPNAYVKFSQYEKFDIADKSIDAGITVANFFVSNITYPAHFVKGAIQNESGNRLKSGAKETFDSSVFSYATKGKPFIVKSGDLATLTYYTKDVTGQASSSTNTVEQVNTNVQTPSTNTVQQVNTDTQTPSNETSVQE